MVSKKIYSSREQRVMKHSYGGYLKVNDGIIKLFVRCGGILYRKKSIDLYQKIKDLLEKDGYILEG